MILNKSIKLVLLLTAVSSLYASDEIMVNRYETISIKPLEEQINPLLAIAEFRFPIQIQTVGDATAMVLRQTGYSLSTENQSKYVVLTLEKPLPVTLRNLGPIKISDSLEVLMGKRVFQLVEDPINRKVDFKLRKEFANKTGVNNELTKSKANKG